MAGLCERVSAIEPASLASCVAPFYEFPFISPFWVFMTNSFSQIFPFLRANERPPAGHARTTCPEYLAINGPSASHFTNKQSASSQLRVKRLARREDRLRYDTACGVAYDRRRSRARCA